MASRLVQTTVQSIRSRTFQRRIKIPLCYRNTRVKYIKLIAPYLSTYYIMTFHIFRCNQRQNISRLDPSLYSIWTLKSRTILRYGGCRKAIWAIHFNGANTYPPTLSLASLPTANTRWMSRQSAIPFGFLRFPCSHYTQFRAQSQELNSGYVLLKWFHAKS